MQVIAINGTPLSGQTPAQASALLQAAPPGPLTLECGGIPVMAIKETKETRIGMTLHPFLGYLRIQKLVDDKDGCLFRNTQNGDDKDENEGCCLKVGQRITAIHTSENSLIDPNHLTDARFAIQFLKDAVGPISISAIDVEGLVTTIVEKPQPDSKVGVILRLHEDIESECVHNENNYIFVRKVTRDGLLDKALPPSYTIKMHRVVSINGQPCPETLLEANDMIRDAPHRVILETIPTDWGLTAQQLAEEPSIPILQTGQILATILKENTTKTATQQKKKIGLKLTRIFDNRHGGSRLVISHIEKELEFVLLGLNNHNHISQQYQHQQYNYALQLGMHLISINSHPCNFTMTTSQAAELFEQATGTIHIVASPIVAKTIRPTPDTKLGLTLDKTKVGIVIAKIQDGGLLASSDLQVGQKIVSINGQKCPLDLKDAMQLLSLPPGNDDSSSSQQQQQQELTITALDVVPELIPIWPEDCLVTATAYKPLTTTVVGVGLNKSVQGRIVISRVWEKGLFARSALQVGLVLLTINGVTCPSNTKAAVQLIKEAKGELTLLCAKSVECARKPPLPQFSKTPVKMGISLGSTSKGIVVADLDMTNGLFQWDVLKRNQRVIKINGKPCPERLQDAIAMLKEAPAGSIVSVEAVDTLTQKYEWPEDCLVNVAATKTHSNQYVGLRLVPSTTHRVVISHIDSTGLLGKFTGQLIPGMVIVSINGLECPDTCDETINLLNSFPEGRVLTLVAAKTVSHLYKASDQKWGLSLAKTTRGNITVHRIDPSGAVAQLPRSLLKVNQRVVDINGKRCPKSVKDAAALLRKAADNVVMTTVDSFVQLWSPDEELVVTVSKRTTATRVGLGLMRSAQGRIAVSSVDEIGLFTGSGIQLGYVVSSINSKACPPSAKEAIARIQQTVGDLTIVFAKTVASIKKPDPDATLGIKLATTRQQGVVVHTIGSDSVFEASNLLEGQKIISINGIPCPQKLDAAVALLQSATGELTIEAIDAVYPVWSPECLVTAYVFKSTRQKFVGLDFSLSKQGRLAIARVDDKGLFANKGIFEGHVVVAINGKQIDAAFEARQILQDCIGELTVVVAHSAETAEKENTDAFIGLSLGLDSSEGVIIEGIESNGLFSSTRLLAGQKLVSINNHACPPSVPEAIAMLKQAEGSLQIVARDAMDDPVWPKEGLVTAIVKKESKGSKVGIGFSVSTQGRLVVATIKKESLLAKSGLQIGQIVLSINEEPAPETPSEALKAVREREVEVSIVATSVVATAIKQFKDETIGLAIGRTTRGLEINKIEPAGIFSTSGLQKDQLIRSINGRPCPESVKDAMAMLREAEGMVNLVVLDSLQYKFEWPSSCLATVDAVKEYPNQFVGLEVAKGRQGRVVIARVDEKGIFAGKGLLQGLVILNINNTDCPATVEETIQLMNQSPLQLSLEVARSVATVYKPSKDSKIGLTIGMTEKYGIIISGIDKAGLFVKSPLSEKQKLLSINGHCPSTVNEATSLIQAAEGELTIEAVDAVVRDYSDQALFTAVARKTVDHSFCGIGILRSLQGRVCIGRIDGGIFAGSGLMPGHIIVSINGIQAVENVKKVVDLLAAQENGDIGIVVATTIASVPKDSTSIALGLSLWRNKAHGVAIHSIDQTGLFGSSVLQEQQQIMSINGQPCGSDVKAAIQMLGEATGELTIVAVDGVRPQFPSECIVTSMAQKASIGDYVGVEVKRINRKGDDRLIISRIDKLGLFANSPGLMVGQTLVSIHGTHFPSSPEEFISNLKEARVGQLVLVTATTIVTVEKSAEETELGISLASSIGSDKPFIIVSRIAKNGLFEPTMLRVGQRIVRINGQPCPKTPQEAISAIKSVVGPLSIEFVENVPSQPGEVTVSVRKRSKGTKLGISMRKSLQGRIIISNIADDGVLANSVLRTGLHVLSINNGPCPDSTKEAVDMIANAKGVVIIVASSSIARVPKSSSTLKFGLSFAKNSNGVVIFRLDSDGLFGNSPLRVGQKVVSINGQTCPSEVADAIILVQEATQYVEIEAVDVLYHWSEEDKKAMAREERQEQAKSDEDSPSAVSAVAGKGATGANGH